MTSCDQVIKDHMILRWELLTLSQYFDQYDTYRPYKSGDIALLSCHVVSRDHRIKGTYDRVNDSGSTYVTALPILMLIGRMV